MKLNVFTRPAQHNIVAGQKTNRNTRPISKEEVPQAVFMEREVAREILPNGRVLPGNILRESDRIKK